MRWKITTLATAIAAVLTLSQPVHAENWTDTVTITGFANSTYQKTDSEEKFNGDEVAVTKDGSTYGTGVGLNINANINEKVSIASQLFSSSEEHGYATHLDWGFISLELIEDLHLRSGKIKNPVGIVNEYQSVGYLYPWIAPPQLYYSEEMSGPMVTRESYSGSSLYWENPGDEWFLSADLFYGEDAVESMEFKELSGLTVSGEWNDQVLLQASYMKGLMHTPSAPAMNEQEHSTIAIGTRINLDNLIAYMEWADVDMENYLEGKGKSWYATLGYKTGRFTPHITYQAMEKGLDSTTPSEQNMTTMGMRYDWMPGMDIKFEISNIKTKKGAGLFENAPDKTVKMYGVAVNVMF